MPAVANIRQNTFMRLGTPIPSLPTSLRSQAVYQFSPIWFLTKVLLCVGPPAALLSSGKATLAATCFWGMLGLLCAVTVFSGKRDELVCLLLAVAPFISLLRGFAFYNVVLALFGGTLLWHVITAFGAVVAVIKKCPMIVAIFCYTVFYYSLSFYNSGDYATNLRLFEFTLTACFVLLLSRNRILLGAAFSGLIVSACLVGISMLPYVRSDVASRLGVILVEGRALGNPTQLGIPLAFGFLALVVDRGQWLNLQQKPLLRLLLLMATLPLLALTTSRASWLVSAGGIFLNIFLGSRQRLKMVFIIGLVILALQGVLATRFGSTFKRGIDRTFSDKRSVRQRTSGRSDQWKVAFYVFQRSPNSMIYGYGPGMGPTIYSQFSGEVDDVKYGIGKKVALHSLFMQIMVETGSLGLIALMMWLVWLVIKIIGRMSHTKVIFPLTCIAGYVFTVITVSGSDINSGVFLGTALIGTQKLFERKTASKSNEAKDLHPSEQTSVTA